MTVGELKKALENIPDDTEVLFDSEAAQFHTHMVNLLDAWYINLKDSAPEITPHVSIRFDPMNNKYTYPRDEADNETLCPACGGTGFYDSNGSPKCKSCNGTGRRR